MSELRTSSPPTPGELAALRKAITLTEAQISTTSALIAALNEDLEGTNEEQRRLEAELATRRQSLLEWTQSRDVLSKVLQCLNSRVKSWCHVAHIGERAANPTETPSDDELARKLVEQENSDINAMSVSMDMRELTISVLRSRIAVLEEDIAGCKRVSSHTKSMIALQASHKDQLRVLLGQHKLRLRPLILLPDTCLRDIFLHVVQLSWEEWEMILRADDLWTFLRFRGYLIDPMFALTAVCHLWRMVATHTPELWSKILIFGSSTHPAFRLARHVRLLKDRELSIVIVPMPWGKVDIQSLEIVKSSSVKLDTLILSLFGDRVYVEQAMNILPSPRVLMLRALGKTVLHMSLPQELLSRTEELYARRCLPTTEFTVPTLQRLELYLEGITPLAPSTTYIPALLQHLPRLHHLSIQCQTTRDPPTNPQPPSLLVSSGVCESVTYLQIPIMALRGPLEGLQALFTFPNLVRLSVLNFLQEGSDLQSWRYFCRLNGGKINRLDLDADPVAIRRNPLSPDELASEIARYLHHLAGIKHLSLDACLVPSLVLGLVRDDRAKKGKDGGRLLVPDLKIFEIRCAKDSAVRAHFEEVFSSWNQARNIKTENKATGAA